MLVPWWSGTRHQGWECLRLGRILFLVESVANNPYLAWPQEMIAKGRQSGSRESQQRVRELKRGDARTLAFLVGEIGLMFTRGEFTADGLRQRIGFRADDVFVSLIEVKRERVLTMIYASAVETVGGTP